MLSLFLTSTGFVVAVGVIIVVVAVVVVVAAAHLVPLLLCIGTAGIRLPGHSRYYSLHCLAPKVQSIECRAADFCCVV